MKETLKGALFVIAAMLIFGFMGVFVRFLGLPSFVIVFFMFLFSAIILFLFFLFKDKSIIFLKKYKWLILLLGAFNLLNNDPLYCSSICSAISTLFTERTTRKSHHNCFDYSNTWVRSNFLPKPFITIKGLHRHSLWNCIRINVRIGYYFNKTSI